MVPFGDVTMPELSTGSLPRQVERIARQCPAGSLLVGHSLGAIVALQVAALTSPRAVVLTSGFFPPARNGRTYAASLRDYGAHRLAVVRRRATMRTRPRLGLAPSLFSLARLGLRPGRFHELAATVTAPVLVVHGDADHYVPIDFAEAAAARHPHWILRVIPGAGHEPHVEQPSVWLDITTTFLQGL